MAKVLIDGPRELEIDYAIPESLRDAVVPGARVRVPLRGGRATGTVTGVEPEATAGRDYTLKPITALIADQPGLPPRLIELARWVADYYCAPLEAVMRAILPEPVRAETTAFKRRKIVRPGRDPSPEELSRLARRAPRQAETLALIAAGEGVPLAELSAEAVRALSKKGLVRIEFHTRPRDPLAGAEFLPSAALPLNPAQAECLAAVLEAVADPVGSRPLLLHGVTGSGKTEIYLQAVQRVIDTGRTALILVPEISLTPQTIQRFRNRFASLPNGIAVLHSHLSIGERHDEWHRIASGGARIVIGARSAIFAPVENLGLIVVDEEHDPSYKQDTVPRYHGRDAAVIRAGLEQCALVLGSATPSLESWRNVLRGKYQKLELPQRIDGCTLPLVRIIDMRLEKSARHRSAPAIFSEHLRMAIDRRLERGEQVILFLNRRGYAGAIQCPTCGHVIQCPHCSVSLVLHRQPGKLVCHICGYQSLPARHCPSCQNPAIRLAGFGTERVEESIGKIFPTARCARVDTDSMSRKHRLRETLDAFQARKLDILVGTQMLAKGLDFPHVTLVGILHADLGLHIPDFRAGERTFQLLTQVAGRAGRGDVTGEVMIQTFSPHHSAIQHARDGDFADFAEQELEFRHALSFPPFARAVLVTLRSKKELLVEFTTGHLHQRLVKELPDGVICGDPVPSPLQRAEDEFRFQILLRAGSSQRITDPLKAVLSRLPLPREITLTIDVDPHNLA